MFMLRHPLNEFGPFGPRPAPWPFCSTVTASLAANIYRVRLGEIRSVSRRRARVAHARQVAIYLAHVGCGEAMDQVVAGFGRHRTTVRHACSCIEDRRDDANFDRALDLLEGVLRGYLDAFIPDAIQERAQ